MKLLIVVLSLLAVGAFGLKLSNELRATARTAAVGALGVLLSGPVSFITQQQGDSPFTLVQPAHAEFRAAQKRTFFRFAPKLKTGMEFYKTELKQAIDKEDYKVVATLFDEYVSKPEKDFNGDKMDTYLNNHFTRPMTLLAGSFAERANNPKSVGLMQKEVQFEKVIDELYGTVHDRKGDGWFAADIKMPTGKERKAQALKAWAEGKDILNEYVSEVNAGLMLELNPMSTI